MGKRPTFSLMTMRALLDALAFLSRLPIGSGLDASRLSACLPWFFPAGLILGGLATLFSWLLVWLPLSPCLASVTDLPVSADVACQGSAPGQAICVARMVILPLLTAMVWLCFLAWLTRALHWDGLADLADAAGSGAGGERFWQIMHDSRMGSFGGLAMLAVFLLQWLALAWHLAVGAWVLPILATGWGRACAVCLAGMASPHPKSCLGRLACAGAGSGLVGWHLGLGFALATGLAFSCHGLWQCLLMYATTLALLMRLAALARKNGGLSGDFIGAGVELGQLCFLLWLL